jgi:hypothetical protein
MHGEVLAVDVVPKLLVLPTAADVGHGEGMNRVLLQEDALLRPGAGV